MNVVLVHPQIPQNTGSIARSCASLKTPLHLVGPYPFEISEKKVRRAGLDYWPLVELYQHESWQDFINSLPSAANLVFIDNPGTIAHDQFKFSQNDYLIFGSETKGIPKEILKAYPELPVLEILTLEPKVRSLNLSNAVSIVLFSAFSQLRRS